MQVVEEEGELVLVRAYIVLKSHVPNSREENGDAE